MQREIFVPNAAAIRQARAFLRGSDWTADDKRTVLRFHPDYCHMQPWVVATVAAWALEHRFRGGTIAIANPEKAKYAWRLGLADYLGQLNPAPQQEHEEAGRFIPLRQIRDPKDLGGLLAEIVTLLHVDEEAAKGVMYTISEMVRNVLEHSSSATGAIVCAQRYAGERGRKYVSIGIADRGIGVLGSLAKNYALSGDTEAILKAIQPGVTGAQSTMYGAPDNAGAGLFITRRLSEETGGYFAIGSGSAMFRTSTAVRRPKDSNLVFDIGHVPGTIVSVEIGLESENEFNETLAMAREAFGARGRQDRREEVQRRIRFE
jgi:anti-sigma regulatory factor (Ser/Thr protein kinase)